MCRVLVTIMSSEGAGRGNRPASGPEFDLICPSRCPNDWDKRDAAVVSLFFSSAYGGRAKMKRRGQDSNLRTSYPVTGLANPRFRPLSHLSELGETATVRDGRPSTQQEF
jgi:hypothetical protein